MSEDDVEKQIAFNRDLATRIAALDFLTVALARELERASPGALLRIGEKPLPNGTADDDGFIDEMHEHVSRALRKAANQP